MPCEIGHGESIVRGGIHKIGGQCAIYRVAPAVSQLGLQDAGGAGAEEYANALCAILVAGGCHGLGKAVLHQPHEREPVIAAIEGAQARGKLYGIHTRDLANEGLQINRVEGARHQAATALAQCSKRLVEAATDAAGRSEMGEMERVQGEVILS